MRHKDLKDLIKKKFGTISSFCRIADLELGKTKAFLNRKFDQISEAEQSKIKNLHEVYKKSANDSGEGSMITNDERTFILESIKERCRNVTAFVEKYPEWDYYFITNITSGKRKIKSKKVVQFINFIKS